VGQFEFSGPDFELALEINMPRLLYPLQQHRGQKVCFDCIYSTAGFDQHVPGGPQKGQLLSRDYVCGHPDKFFAMDMNKAAILPWKTGEGCKNWESRK
jgi:hypothetical protein